MRILYYIPYISKENGGLYQYSIALLKILVKDQQNEYFILNVNSNSDVLSIVTGKANFNLLSPNDYVSIDKWGNVYNRIKKSLTLRIKSLSGLITFESYFDSLLRKYSIDFIHCPYQDLPESKIPGICTMHDVQELHFPAFFSSADRARRAVHYKDIIDRATKVIVSYNHIREDIINLFGKPAEDVHTILLDMENLWIDKYVSTVNVSSEMKDLPEKFLLYPAATWHHKNHINLIKAVHILKEQKGIAVKVVCTGHKTDYYNELDKCLVDLNVKDNFQFIGIVTDETLYSLYKQAHGVVVPTMYEAGSFPLMESILLGTAVICSNVTSLPETIGNADFTFDPRNTSEIAMMIDKLWNDDSFYKRNLEVVKERAGTLRWNDALSKIKLLYAGLEGKNKVKASK